MARTPTGRNVNDYEGKVPAAKGTGPRNFTKTGMGPQPKGGRKVSSAATPKLSPALAKGGNGKPSGGGGGGVPKATTSFAMPKGPIINKPKKGPQKVSRRAPIPKGHISSKI